MDNPFRKYVLDRFPLMGSGKNFCKQISLGLGLGLLTSHFPMLRLLGRPTAKTYFRRGLSTASDELLKRIGKLGTQAAVDALWLEGYPQSQIDGARPLRRGQKIVGRAVTLRFVPHRPDLARDKPQGEESAEYVAFEKCGPNEVLVIASTGPWESVGGDIKFLRLAQRGCRGLVTDGSVRDTEILEEYNLNVFSHSSTSKQGPAVHQPWGVNEVISIGSVLCRPGDIILGDDDGCVVIPQCMAERVVEIASEREEIEDMIKDELKKNPGSPGKFYPFRQPIDPNSPLGRLVQKRREGRA